MFDVSMLGVVLFVSVSFNVCYLFHVNVLDVTWCFFFHLLITL